MTRAILFYGPEEGVIADIRILEKEMQNARVTCSSGINEDHEYSFIRIKGKHEMTKYSKYAPIVIDYTFEDRDYEYPCIRVRFSDCNEDSKPYYIKKVFEHITEL